jgi:hypothetical protein
LNKALCPMSTYGLKSMSLGKKSIFGRQYFIEE